MLRSELGFAQSNGVLFEPHSNKLIDGGCCNEIAACFLVTDVLQPRSFSEGAKPSAELVEEAAPELAESDAFDPEDDAVFDEAVRSFKGAMVHPIPMALAHVLMAHGSCPMSLRCPMSCIADGRLAEGQRQQRRAGQLGRR